jgi:hypothetical protein
VSPARRSLADSLRSAGAQLEQASTGSPTCGLNQHVIDGLPSGLATTDPMQRILTFKRAAETITGVVFRSASAASPRCCVAES